MNRNRRIVYKFLNLPHHIQYKILTRLKLITKDEIQQNVKDVDLFIIAFKRAKKQNLIDKIETEINNESIY
jgi:hypothetical protein